MLVIKKRIEFKGSCLKQGKIICTHGKIVNLCIAYEISKNYHISNYSSLKDCLLGAVSLTKKAGIDKLNILDVKLDLIDMDSFSS